MAYHRIFYKRAHVIIRIALGNIVTTYRNIKNRKYFILGGDINYVWETRKNMVTDAANELIGKSKPVKNYRSFWEKELDSLLKQRRDANRLKRLHDKTRVSDNDLGKNINTLYRNRKLKPQEAIKRKEQVFQMKQFNDKCINSKNKMKVFEILSRSTTM
jgi:hypothetical protein